MMEQVYSSEPNNEVIVNYLGRVYKKLNRDQDAINLYNTFLQSNSSSKIILYSLGVIYYLNDQIDESIAAMRKLIQIDPNNADALNFVGYTYAEQGKNLDEAEMLIKRALELSPNKGYILDSLGWVYYKRGKYDEAIELLNRASELQPDDPSIMEHLGDVYFDKGEFSKALEYYQRGIYLVDQDTENNDPKLKERLYKKTNDLKTNISAQN